MASQEHKNECTLHRWHHLFQRHDHSMILVDPQSRGKSEIGSQYLPAHKNFALRGRVSHRSPPNCWVDNPLLHSLPQSCVGWAEFRGSAAIPDPPERAPCNNRCREWQCSLAEKVHIGRLGCYLTYYLLSCTLPWCRPLHRVGHGRQKTLSLLQCSTVKAQPMGILLHCML